MPWKDPTARWTGIALLGLLREAKRVHASVVVRIDAPGEEWAVEMADADYDALESVFEPSLLAAVEHATRALRAISTPQPDGLPSDDQASLLGGELMSIHAACEQAGGGVSLSARYPAAKPASYTLNAFYQLDPLKHRTVIAPTLLSAIGQVRGKLADVGVHVPPVA